MRNSGRLARTDLLVAFSLLFLLGTAAPSLATGNIVKSDLKGTWRIALRGATSCGFSSVLATVTFGATGSGTGPLQIHGGCGDSTLQDQTFTVTTLTAKGTGKATLTCGPGCVWHFDIQMAPDRSRFNLVDVAVTDTDTFLQGVAILGSADENIVTSDLEGDWQVMLFGKRVTDCGTGPAVFTFTAVGTLTLNAAGSGNMNATTVHSSCGDFPDPTNPFTILGLNAAGSGTANLICASDCDVDLEIQVTPDRSTFNLVTVSPTETGVFLAGVAIRRSTTGHIVKANLAGPWQLALGGQDGGAANDVAAVMTFTLNAKGVSTNVNVVFHDSDDGDGTLTGGFSIGTLNTDGGGTAVFTCGENCVLNFKIQVSPDRSTFSIVDVSTPGEFYIGTAVHK